MSTMHGTDLEPNEFAFGSTLRGQGARVSMYGNSGLCRLARKAKKELVTKGHQPCPGYVLRILDLDDGSTIATLVVEYKEARTERLEQYTIAL